VAFSKETAFLFSGVVFPFDLMSSVHSGRHILRASLKTPSPSSGRARLALISQQILSEFDREGLAQQLLAFFITHSIYTRAIES
jgi:hypothetical protein